MPRSRAQGVARIRSTEISRTRSCTSSGTARKWWSALDRGKVKSTSSDSVTITENDGSDVTIPVDGQTRVFAGFAKRNAKVSDLKEGQLVTVDREEGKAARVIAVMPKFRRFGAHPPGPPPGGPPGGMLWHERDGSRKG